jgi:isocitrate lyase
VRLRGSVQIEHTLARLGAQRLWALLHERDFVAALGVEVVPGLVEVRWRSPA